jgi:hypothetical protein
MRVVIHRVDAPIVARAVVCGVADAVEQRVAQLHIRRGQVALGAQHMRAIGKLAGAHAAEEVEILRHAAVAIGAGRPASSHRAAILADFFFVQAVDIGAAIHDQLLGELVELRVVVRRKKELVAPIESRASAHRA